MVSSPAAVERRPESNSSGSLGVSPEVLQAEVSKRSDEAALEIQRLRAQLENYEAMELPLEFPQIILYLVPGAQDDHLLTTLVKGIEALLRQQQTARNDRPETVKPGITELPHLPEYQPSTGSIDLLHWLTHISPIMEDLSDTSLAWWQETMKEAMAWYSEYESASPLARLQLQPRPSVELRPEWARVERRATAMMLTAIPKPIREEIIAHGQEKTLVLRMLELKEYVAGGCESLFGYGDDVLAVNFEGVADAQMKVLKVLQDVCNLEGLKRILNAINRWPRDQVEWEQARSVSVQLAGDSSVTMKQTPDGTLLSGDDLAQVIVPLGKVISTLGYRLHWTQDVCELLSDESEVLPLNVVKGCPELPESTATTLINQLEAKQLPELRQSTTTTVKAVYEVKQSWWSHLVDYVRTGSTESGRRAVDKAEFFDYKQVVKDKLVIRQPRPGVWELMKALTLNRRARKRLLRASSWLVRWDPPSVDRRRDEFRHLSYVGDSVYVDVNNMLVDNEFDDIWKIVWWAAVQGRISTVVARDAAPKPLDQLAAAPHRSRLHWLHALASAGRTVRGGDSVRLYVEGYSSPLASRSPTSSTTTTPWSANQDSIGYMREMGLMDVMIDGFFRERVARLAKMDTDTEWKLHVMRNHTPFRRDCSVCVRNAATGRQHRSTSHPAAYVLSMDIAGPIKGRGLSPDGKYFRFFLVGAFRIPVIEGGVGRDEELRGYPLPNGVEPFEEEEDELSEDERAGDEAQFEEEISDFSGDELRKEREQWEKLKASFKQPLKTETIYFCVPVNGKKAIYTLPALQQMITEIRALGYPVVRVHSDRGGEFRGNLVKRWLAGQGIMRTTSTGSEPAENGVAEAGVRYLKRRARTLLDAGKLSRVHWPTAIQTAAVQQRCWKLGIPDPTPVYQETMSTATSDPELRGLRADVTYELELMAVKFLEDGEPTLQGCAALLEKIGLDCGNLKVPRAKDGCGLLLGAYVHGGTFGVTSLGKELKWTTYYLNKFLARRLRETMANSDNEANFTWTTIALQHASEVPLHRDVHNQRDSRNFVMEIKCDDHAGLWVQDDQDECGVQGGVQAVDHQWQAEDGTVYEGCLVNIKNNPAAFNPRLRHGYLRDSGARWFLSAYTPHGVHRLSEADKMYLESCGFPFPPPREAACSTVLETRPMLKATFFPQSINELDGVHSLHYDVEDDVAACEDDDETCGDWGIYVEEGPREECDLLWRTSQTIMVSTTDATYQEDIAECAEEWVGDQGCLSPRMAKLEPEYTPNIEGVIKELVSQDTPLRHTHNVNPQEVRHGLEKWKPAILKELGVIEKGFRRSNVTEVQNLKATHKELPAKLVYTLKPPSSDSMNEGEAKYCKRKARIVCCGNYASEDQADIFASGAAAESLRSCLTFSAWRRWVTALLDIAGAFMLTPLPTGPNEVVYAVHPPSVLVKLGLASEEERWILTHGMYGLRQSPRLWSEFRDKTITDMRFYVEDEEWQLKQGDAEPNLWLLVKTKEPGAEPGALVLIYVDDILLYGRMPLLRSVADKLSSTWKTTELEVLSATHGIRFLGCEILTTEAKDCYYLHQQPYIKEILKAHDVPETARSPIQAPKHLVTFEAEESEPKGDVSEIKLAQRLCGELLWLAQRTRPDISFTVNAMGALISRAAPRCIMLGTKLLSYLQHTQDYILTIAPRNDALLTYTDSSYAPEGKRCHSGILVTWMGAPISWRATRTPYVCLSTAESELTAAIEGLKMTMSLGAVLEELEGKELPIQLAIDNQSTIAIAKPTGSTSWRTRHLRVRSAFIREQIQNEKVTVKYVKGQQQLADLLTKAFPRQRLEVDATTQTTLTEDYVPIVEYLDREVPVPVPDALPQMLVKRILQFVAVFAMDPSVNQSSLAERFAADWTTAAAQAGEGGTAAALQKDEEPKAE
ncbi:unnamed protein product, partial [Symbiodinium microadriaticum]